MQTYKKELLYGFVEPNLIEEDIGSLSVRCENGVWKLRINGKQYMCYRENTKKEAFEILNHVRFAYGHVMCTGLGFGLRESWILSKPTVSKLTILEKSSEVIEYHKRHSNWLNDPRVEILNIDCLEYIGSCDVLLVDHYQDHKEYSNDFYWIEEAEKLQENIKCNLIWVWPTEFVLSIRGAAFYPELSSRLKVPKFAEHQVQQLVDDAIGINI